MFCQRVIYLFTTDITRESSSVLAERSAVPFGVFGSVIIQSVTCLVFSEHIMYFANQLRPI